MYAYMCIYIYVYMHVCSYDVYVCMHVYTCLCVYVCIEMVKCVGGCIYIEREKERKRQGDTTTGKVNQETTYIVSLIRVNYYYSCGRIAVPHICVDDIPDFIFR